MLDTGTEIVLACLSVLYRAIQIICWHRPTCCTSLAPPWFDYDGNCLDSGVIRRPGLIGRYVMFTVRFCSIGKPYRCTSGVGFTWWSQGCWNGHKFHWKIIHSVGLPNKVLANLMHRLLFAQSADSWTVGNIEFAFNFLYTWHVSV